MIGGSQVDTSQQTIAFSDLQATLKSVEQLCQHLQKQGKPSKQDIAALRQIIFHLDSLLTKLQSNKIDGADVITSELVKALKESNQHLRAVLLSAENTTYIHKKTGHQDSNDRLFSQLVSQIASLHS